MRKFIMKRHKQKFEWIKIWSQNQTHAEGVNDIDADVIDIQSFPTQTCVFSILILTELIHSKS